MKTGERRFFRSGVFPLLGSLILFIGGEHCKSQEYEPAQTDWSSPSPSSGMFPVDQGVLDSGSSSDSGTFEYRMVGEGAELQARVSSHSSTGDMGIMVRDNLETDSAFFFLGVDTAGAPLIMIRRNQGEAISLIPLNEGSISATGKRWFRVLIGTDTVYAFHSTDNFTTAAGLNTWGFLGAFKLQLSDPEGISGGKDYGGTFVENSLGSHSFSNIFQSTGLVWSERTSRVVNLTPGTDYSSSSWTVEVNGNAPTESGVYLSNSNTTAGNDVWFPIDVTIPSNLANNYENFFDIYVHAVEGMSADAKVRVENDGAILIAEKALSALVPFGGNSVSPGIFDQGGVVQESSWVWLGRVALARGVQTYNVVVTSDGGGTAVKADAVRAVRVANVSWDYVKWVNHSSKLRRKNFGEAGNEIYRDFANNINWNAGANSSRVLVGDGAVMMRVTTSGKRIEAGLTEAPGGNTNTTIPYRFRMKSNDKFVAYALGQGNSAPDRGYDNGTWMTIHRIGSTLWMRKEDGATRLMLNSAPQATSNPLFLDCSIKDDGGKIKYSRFNGWVTPSGTAGNIDYLTDGEDTSGIPDEDLLEKLVINGDYEDQYQNVFDVELEDDYDGDGLTNRSEVAPASPLDSRFVSNPFLVDTDNDGLTDDVELATFYSTDQGTNEPTFPDNADSDGDGLSDLVEVQNGFNPRKRNSDENEDINNGPLDSISDYTEWLIINDLLNNHSITATQSDIDDNGWVGDTIDHPGDYDNDGVLDIHEDEDRTSSVDSLDYFYAMKFDSIGEISETGVLSDLFVDSEGRQNRILTRTSNLGGDKGGISHHWVKEGSRVRFRFSDAGKSIRVGFRKLFPKWLDPNLHSNAGDPPSHGVSLVGSNGQIVIEKDGVPQGGLSPISVNTSDLIELRMEVVQLQPTVLIEVNQDLKASITLSGVNLSSDRLAVFVELPELNSGIKDGRYRGMFNPDSDGDEIADEWEWDLINRLPSLTDLSDVGLGEDVDQDGLLDLVEFNGGDLVGFEGGTDGGDPDTDGDGLGDKWEVDHGLDPIETDESKEDPDNDELSNLKEFLLTYGSDPNSPRRSNPLSNDSDGDDVPDGLEVDAGRDPTIADAANVDTDGDLVPDKWEYENGGDMHDDRDGGADMDYDRLSNLTEYTEGYAQGVFREFTAIPEIAESSEGLTVMPVILGSLNDAGHLARVIAPSPGTQLYVEFWKGGTWSNSIDFGPADGFGKVKSIRQNAFGMVGAVLENVSSGLYEIRVLDLNLGVHRIETGMNWSEVADLHVTDSGYVAAAVKAATGGGESILRWRNSVVEYFPGDGGVVDFVGISERGDLVEKNKGVYRSGAWQELDEVPMAVGRYGEILEIESSAAANLPANVYYGINRDGWFGGTLPPVISSAALPDVEFLENVPAWTGWKESDYVITPDGSFLLENPSTEGGQSFAGQFQFYDAGFSDGLNDAMGTVGDPGYSGNDSAYSQNPSEPTYFQDYIVGYNIGNQSGLGGSDDVDGDEFNNFVEFQAGTNFDDDMEFPADQFDLYITHTSSAGEMVGFTYGGDNYFDGTTSDSPGFSPVHWSHGKMKVNLGGDQALNWKIARNGHIAVSNYSQSEPVEGMIVFAWERGILSPTNDALNSNGLPDDWEDYYSVTDPLSDVDNDGLTAFYEYVFSTDPNEVDSDGDSGLDAWEISLGFNPEVKDVADEDNDGIADLWELENGLNPGNPFDATEDSDGDSRTNLEEYLAGTDKDDYFDGASAIIVPLTQSHQTSPPSVVFADTFRVRVEDPQGNPLVNAPVQYSVTQGTGQLLEPGGSGGASYVSVVEYRTDQNGEARIYAGNSIGVRFKQADGIGVQTTIVASASDGTTTFTALTVDNYYNGITPVLTKVSGDQQSERPDTITEEELVLQVYDNGSPPAPLVHAPVTFTVNGSNSGKLLEPTTSGNQLVTTIDLTTDENGIARMKLGKAINLFFKTPSSQGVTTITASAGGAASKDFTVTTLSPVSDSDGDGLDDVEELAHNTDPNNPDSDYDGVNDGLEVSEKTDPLSNTSSSIIFIGLETHTPLKGYRHTVSE